MNKKRLVSFCALVLVLVLAFPAAPAFAENNAYVKKTDAGRINLRSGPASQYRVLAAIDPGTPLEVLDVVGKWAHIIVASPNGLGDLEGYMYTDYIEDYSGKIIHSYPMDTTASSQSSYSGAYNSFAWITENTPMYVCTGNSGRLHLREYPSQNARSLGLFPNGTQVTVLNRSGLWAYVSVNGLYGYMMLYYLTQDPYTPVQPIVPPYPTVIKYVNTGNSGRLHLREYPSQNARSLGLFPNGTKVSAADLCIGWTYVSVNGLVGYMMNIYLSSTAPDPYQPTQYTIRYVYSPDGTLVDLRAGMSASYQSLGRYSNGTQVRVYYNWGTWSYVSVNGNVGYMLSSQLSASPYIPPHPTIPIGTATVRHPNGSFVYLRSTRSTASLDNVLAKVPSGARVTVYEKDEWYSLIEYNGVYGYMVSHFLDWGTSPAPSPTEGTVVRKMIVGGTSLRSSREEGGANNIIMELPHGAIVEILLTYPDEWRYVDYNGVKGYIHGQVVASITSGDPSPYIPVVPESPVIFIGVVYHPYGSFVNLRYSCSAEDNTNVLAQVPSGAKVEVMEQTGSWSKVRYNGVVGYMVSSYILAENGSSSSTAPGSVPSTQIIPAQPTGGSVSGNKRVVYNKNSGFVYLRSSKDSSNISNVLMKVYNGTVVELLKDEGLWSFISVGGTTGYMVSSYLAIETSSSSESGSAFSAEIAPAQTTSVANAQKPVSSLVYHVTPAQSSRKTGRYLVRGKNGGNVKIRSSKDDSSSDNVLFSLSSGAVVELLKDEGKWCFVRFQGIEGYVLSEFLVAE